MLKKGQWVVRSFCLGIFLSLARIEAADKVDFEGVRGLKQNLEESTFKNFMRIVSSYLPYNPVIIEVRGRIGENTQYLAAQFPKGHVITFEADPQLFEQLVINIKSFQNISAFNLTLIDSRLCRNNLKNREFGKGAPQNCDLENEAIAKGQGARENRNSEAKPTQQKPDSSGCCGIRRNDSVVVVNFGDWCRSQQLSHIDLIRLDVGGFELQTIESMRDVLKTVSVIFTKTNPGKSHTGFERLKKHLHMQGFSLLSHWYEENSQGEAIFINKKIYDSIYQ